MPLNVTELGEELRETNQRLTGAIDALRTEVSDLKVHVAEINTNLRWLKGIGRIVAGSAVGILILIGTGVYRFGRVENAMVDLQGRMGRVEAAVIGLQKDTADLRLEIKARDERLNHTLDRIAEKLDREAPALKR